MRESEQTLFDSSLKLLWHPAWGLTLEDAV